MYSFLEEVSTAIDMSDEAALLDIWSPALEEVRQRIIPMSLVDTTVYQYTALLKFMTRTVGLAQVTTFYLTPI